jgi:membrane-associated protease RseP (regulator of RpoE activity)
MIGAAAPAMLALSALLQVAHEPPTFQGPRIEAQASSPTHSLVAYQEAQQPAQGQAEAYHQLRQLGYARDFYPQREANALLGQYVLARAGSEHDGLGLTLEKIDDVARKQLKLPDGRGLVVTSVVPGGPAEKVGLQAQDILLTLNDQPLGEPAALETLLKEAGEKAVPLALLRGGKPLTIPVKPRYRVTFGPVESEKPQLYIGVRTSPVDGLLRTHLSLPEGQGLVVNSVVENSPAQKTGIREGDLLLEVDEKALSETETLGEAVRASEGKPLNLKLIREGQTLALDVKPEPRPASEGTNEAQTTWLYQLQPTQTSLGHLLSLQPQVNAADAYRQMLTTGQWVRAEQPADNDRIEALTKEVEALRKLVEELKEAVKKD